MHKKNIQVIEKSIFSRVGSRIELGLERFSAALAQLGNPHQAFPTIHVAGSKGKGTICYMLEQALRNRAARTGRYTSPHLRHMHERFAINGCIDTENQWVEVYGRIEKIAIDHKLTFFEITTLLAFEIFRNNNVDVAVIETGLGGRLDATNVVHPQLSIIGALALEHQEYLGDTLEQIATEKLGIVKPGVALVMLEPPQTSLQILAAARCKEVGSSLYFVNPEATPRASNCALVQKALEVLGHRGPLTEEEKSIGLPARFQHIQIASQRFLLDVAHTPDSIEALVKNISTVFSNPIVLAGFSSDKKIGEMLEILQRFQFSVCLVGSSNARVASKPMYQALGGQIAELPFFDSIATAMQWCSQETEVVVCGSFFVIGDFYSHFNLHAW